MIDDDEFVVEYDVSNTKQSFITTILIKTSQKTRQKKSAKQ